MPNKPSTEATIAVLGPDQLGEGPVWDDRSGELVRVDISGRLVHRWNPATGEATSFETEGDVGAAVLCEEGGLVLAVECELWRVEPSGEMDIARPMSIRNRVFGSTTAAPIRVDGCGRAHCTAIAIRARPRCTGWSPAAS